MLRKKMVANYQTVTLKICQTNEICFLLVLATRKFELNYAFDDFFCKKVMLILFLILLLTLGSK